MKTFPRLAALALAVCLIGELALAAPETDGPNAPTATEPATVKAKARYEFYARQGLPPEYRNKVNPYPQPTVPVVIRGADLYNVRCASCHGLMGFGDGAAGGGLRQRPADLAWSLSDPTLRDDFLYWTIAEGGAQFATDMPSYKKMLSETQIWEIVTYMRAAFEGREAGLNAVRARKQASR
jgi:mono/diheme cytochrome c family protein